MRINIESIPHDKQRYPTCGDWWFDGDGTLQVRVSEEMPEASQKLVVIHELAEVIMCQANGVNQGEVDQYDMEYENNRADDDDTEPGDHEDAPYFTQHGLATAIERIVATQMGVSWIDHEKAVNALFEK